MSTLAPTLPAASGIEDAFLDLVYADDELLRAEFDALISAAWPNTPDPPRARFNPCRRRRPARRRRARGSSGRGSRRAHRPGTDGWVRQRSPP